MTIDFIVGAVRASRDLHPQVKTALEDVLHKAEPQEMEMEGGGRLYWHVCPECHTAVDTSDHYCRHCGQAIK